MKVSGQIELGQALGGHGRSHSRAGHAEDRHSRPGARSFPLETQSGPGSSSAPRGVNRPECPARVRPSRDAALAPDHRAEAPARCRRQGSPTLIPAGGGDAPTSRNPMQARPSDPHSGGPAARSRTCPRSIPSGENDRCSAAPPSSPAWLRRRSSRVRVHAECGR
jgi:hypothetical protein